MNPYSRLMQTIRDSLTAALPRRLVARDFLDHSLRDFEELRQHGVITVLMQTNSNVGDWVDQIDLVVVGQVAVDGREQTPADAEDAELQIYNELLAWARNPGPDMPRLDVRSASFSAQHEFPFGFCALKVICGPLEIADFVQDDDPPEDGLYPATVTPPTPLDGVDADIDIEPHETRAEHERWLRGDYAGSRPELQTRVDMNKDQGDD